MKPADSNPFAFPGFGQSGEMGRNPVLAGMEMMQQAWQGMAKLGADPGQMTPPMNLEELDKRIADLRIVENWLRMNTSMLTGAIQALEVQRATLNTLKSYADFSAAGAASDESGPPSPAQAAQAWWNLMQQQFDRLAAAGMGAVPSGKASAGASAGGTDKPATPRKTPGPRKRTASTAKKSDS